MNKIVIGIHHRWLSDVMSALHQEGNLEIIDLKKSAGEEIPQKQLDLPRQEIEQIISLHFRIDRAFEVLAPYEKTPRGIPSILSPKSAQRIKTNYSTREEVLAAAREELRQVESVHFASESLKRNRELQQTARDHITDMRRLLILGCDLSYLAPSPYTAAVAGWIDERARPLLESWQASSHSDEISVYTAPSGNEIIVLCIGTRAMTPLLEELIHQSWFVHIQLPESYSGNPEERIAAEESKIDALRKEKRNYSLISMPLQRVISRICGRFVKN
jgi:vacuolar-type H+-ATPase subunit I/STV1